MDLYTQAASGFKALTMFNSIWLLGEVNNTGGHQL